MADPLNWAGNLRYGSKPVLPRNLDHLREIVAGAEYVRAVGSRHSFNDIADCSDTIIDMRSLNRVLKIDPDRRIATVEGGAIYSELTRALESEGWALHNLASLPHISIAGAIATATHGSGDQNGNLASAVAGLEFVRADGTLEWVRQGDPDFLGSVVNLGALGIVSKVELRLEPTFQIRQDVYQNLPFGTLEPRFEEVTSSAYSVSLFTRWRTDAIEQVWLKSKDLTPPREERFGIRRAVSPMHPIPELDPAPCTEQGIPGPWLDRLPHFRPELAPSGAGAELQTEYLVPRPNAMEAIRQVAALRGQLSPLLLTSEIRTMASDGLWMSPACHHPSVGIHFTWRPMGDQVAAVLPILEERLLPLGALPHWGKLFHTRGVAHRYPRASRFRDLAQRVDPSGKFWNPYLRGAWDTI